MSDIENTSVAARLLLGEQLCFAVYSASHAFARRYKPHLDRLGITYPQFLCMLVLWEQDGVTVKAIGERLHLDSGTLTPLLKRLEVAGLVQRARDKDDERMVRVRLTDRGQALHSRAIDIPPAIRCATARSDEDLEHLKNEVIRLRDALNGSGRDA